MGRFFRNALATALLLLACLAPPSLAFAEEPLSGKAPERIVAMEWAGLETLLALGITPVGAADAGGYREWVAKPALPESVADIGSRQEPNLEELARLKPDLILSHAHLRPLKEKLEASARVEDVTFNGTGGDTYQAVLDGTRRVGALTGKTEAAEALIESADTAFAKDAETLRTAGLSDRHVYVVRIIGPNALRIHGKNAVADKVLAKLGLVNAYQGKVNDWGFATAEPSALAEDPDADILVVGPVSDAEMASVFDTPLGKALPAVRAGRVHALPVVWTFGGIPSAITMAGAITDALTGESAGESR
ncbi:iron-siderophore ABC transporter substrate-binding protein [Jiella mangrovi]|uniref:Iron-siderophore ABC transporter substrate-binding protein n=1 Tax=Jiella mangrovi TaxID=2821407 RepID=A0ABS4BI33_9HYPH|nr:iron-siderophore ABC transporter substrate-binding protein [Jiella mangrovi]MBP0616405.1 iron-siderophore ABC transporter substrate-binding protein [Jiella mangrovi]